MLSLRELRVPCGHLFFRVIPWRPSPLALSVFFEKQPQLPVTPGDVIDEPRIEEMIDFNQMTELDPAPLHLPPEGGDAADKGLMLAAVILIGGIGVPSLQSLLVAAEPPRR